MLRFFRIFKAGSKVGVSKVAKKTKLSQIVGVSTIVAFASGWSFYAIQQGWEVRLQRSSSMINAPPTTTPQIYNVQKASGGGCPIDHSAMTDGKEMRKWDGMISKKKEAATG
eukprot:TRINITY_DN3352_c0_g1_i1.p1 TRINITY_DN3352_c0_g1~~TRINITY_DN3352_c0_g1_i1.p1  ORF type:complete len:112 (-),score=26.67 TRINITY_DN3352_c0_g1_i1:81-416(-)